VILHLVTMAFLNEFGYQRQRSSQIDFDRVVSEIEHPAARSRLPSWLVTAGVEQRFATQLFLALDKSLVEA
jgi:hypothetical protein